MDNTEQIHLVHHRSTTSCSDIVLFRSIYFNMDIFIVDLNKWATERNLALNNVIKIMIFLSS